MKNRSIYNDTSMNITIVLFLLGTAMIGLSLYLTQHYMEFKFPTGLESKSLCNFGSFFNCDKTTMSLASNILGVPIALFGAIVGGLVFLGIFIKNEDYERSIYFTLIVNFVGCMSLFFYSLFSLGGLCPFCTLYYIVSGITLWLFYKYSENFRPSFKFLGIFFLIVAAAFFAMKANVDSKLNQNKAIASDLIKQYDALPNLGSPNTPSGHKIVSAPVGPLKMVIFSDFECPACRALSEILPQIILRYGGLIDIEYYFYPLDNNCNPNMKQPMHQEACRAAYFASCLPNENFGNLHDEIFKNQEQLGEYLKREITKRNLQACIDDPKTKEKVVAIINQATPFNIRSTPSFLLNGVKIEGVLPPEQLFSIMDELVSRYNKAHPK